MRNVLTVHLKKTVDDSYPIIIGKNLRDAAKEIFRLRLGFRYFIITDNTVAKLYGNQFTERLIQHGARANLLSVPPGERSKNRATKELLENKLLALNAGRDSVIVALGGGVIGDLAGFIAATLHRGVPYIQIPTTLLSQVDSSIGGKVAVDHPLGKNLIGAFHQPKRVYIDLATLSTLSAKEFSNGMAEVIKHAAILDKQLFGFLGRHHSNIMKREPTVLRKIIRRCCELKKRIVETDEKETGLRRILNFGHTIGHSIETLTKHKLSHGEAVAVGMVAEARMSVSLGLLKKENMEQLQKLLSVYNLPTTLPVSLQLSSLVKATERDKKVRNGRVQYTLLETIGKARVGVTLSSIDALRLLKQ